MPGLGVGKACQFDPGTIAQQGGLARVLFDLHGRDIVFGNVSLSHVNP